MEEPLIGVRAAAAQLGVHENTLRNWEARGVIRSVRLPVSGYRRYRASDIARYAQQMREQLAPADEGPAIIHLGPHPIVHGDID
jgi:DNA-binding transcriptional MerR regulator